MSVNAVQGSYLLGLKTVRVIKEKSLASCKETKTIQLFGNIPPLSKLMFYASEYASNTCPVLQFCHLNCTTE